MKRKFYGVLMLGALAVASASLTSCKDYDDDINNLQTQVNSLSSTVEQKETAIKQLIADLDAAYKKADADLQTAYQQADKDLESGYKAGDVATLAAAKTAIEEAKKALESTISANYESLDAKNKEQDIAIAKAQSDASNALNLLASKANQSDFLVLQNDVQKINTELTKTNAELSQISTALQQAFGDLANLGTALKAQKAALEAVEKLAGQNKADIATNKSAIEVLEKKVATAEEELKKANENIAEANKVIEEVRVAAEARAAKIDSKYETITAMISQDLRSLVYMPKLYMDGIETIEYPWLDDTLMSANTTALTFNRTESDHYKAMNTQQITVNSVVDYTKNKTKPFVYGPVWDVEYHMNPSIANVSYSQVKGFYAYNVETVTRAAWGNPGDDPYTTYPKDESTSTWGGITSPEKYDNWFNADDKVFSVNYGIVTAGIKIKEPNKMVDQKDGVNNVVVALQVKSRINNVDTVITSDYAMLYPERIKLDGIIWNKCPDYWNASDSSSIRMKNYWEITKGYGAGTWVNRTTGRDQQCPNTTKIIHVWDNPKDALTHVADIMLPVGTELDLSQYMGVHYYYTAQKENDTNYPETAQMKKFPKSQNWAYDDVALQRLGLAWDFETVDYTIAGNKTHDSKYLQILDIKKGVIRSANVNEEGVTYEDATHTSVGREPLVRVRLYHINEGKDKPLYDGYIRIHIYKPEYKHIEWPNVETFTFDLCNAQTKSIATWAQFNQWILRQGFTEFGNGLEKSQFDYLYTADLKTGKILNQYTKTTNGDFVLLQNSGDAGTISFADDQLGTTNDTFTWTFTETELESFTHDTSLPVTVERWVHFRGQNAANYDDLFIKFTAKLTRVTNPVNVLTNKNSDYWFERDGKDEGWGAVVFNANPVLSDKSVSGFARPIIYDFLQNNPLLTGTAVSDQKFYFVPRDTAVVDLNGTTWTITAKKSATDTEWDKLFCQYLTDNHNYPKTSDFDKIESDLNKILNECAIAYDKGAFNNKELYAKSTSSSYIKIADMNQVTGEITLDHPTENVSKNDTLNLVLNAIGYGENHKFISEQFHTFVGVIAKNSCNVARQMQKAIFTTSWERPINLDLTAAKNFEDARTNADTLYVVDIFKLYDWRGPTFGKMYDNQQWLWAYYNVKGIELSVAPSKVLTNMGQANDNTWKSLSEVSRYLTLRLLDETGNATITGDHTYWFDLRGYKDQNAALLAYMGIDPENINNKWRFGSIFYANNGHNVEDFDIRIPVKLYYEWGWIYPTDINTGNRYNSNDSYRYIQIHIGRSQGN